MWIFYVVSVLCWLCFCERLFICALWSPAGKGGGGTLIFSHIRRLGLFWGFKILNFNIFGGFQKNKYFLEYEDFVDIFGGSSQNWASFRLIPTYFFDN